MAAPPSGVTEGSPDLAFVVVVEGKNPVVVSHSWHQGVGMVPASRNPSPVRTCKSTLVTHFILFAFVFNEKFLEHS